MEKDYTIRIKQLSKLKFIAQIKCNGKIRITSRTWRTCNDARTDGNYMLNLIENFNNDNNILATYKYLKYNKVK